MLTLPVFFKVKLTDQDQKKRRIDARKQETCQKMLQHIVNSASTLVSFILYLDVDIGQIRSMVLSTNKYFNKGSSMASEMDTANNNNSTQQPPSIVVNKNLTNLTATNISKSTSNNNIAKTSMDKISSSDQRRPSNLPTNIPINVPLPPVLPSPLPSEYSSFLVSHPLKTCFYISIIIQELVRSFIEVRAGLKEKYSSIQAVESVVERFGEAIENLKARTIEGVCASTLNGKGVI